jgi:hypothetical protein
MLEGARFRRLATAHWAERRREYGAFALVLVGLHAVLVTIFLATDQGFTQLTVQEQASTYWLGLMLTLPVFAARHFLPLSHRDAGPSLMLRPASNLEKFLLALLVVLVIYPLAYSLLFYVCNAPAALVAEARAAEAWAKLEPAMRKENVQWEPARYGIAFPGAGTPWREAASTAAMFGVLALWTLFGTLHFRRSPMVKTFVAGFVLFLVVLLVSEWSGGNPAAMFAFLDPDSMLPGWKKLALAGCWVAIPLLSLWACYLALCERESA